MESRVSLNKNSSEQNNTEEKEVNDRVTVLGENENLKRELNYRENIDLREWKNKNNTDRQKHNIPPIPNNICIYLFILTYEINHTNYVSTDILQKGVVMKTRSGQDRLSRYITKIRMKALMTAELFFSANNVSTAGDKRLLFESGP